MSKAAGRTLDFAELKRLLTRTWEEWNTDEAPRLGAALAYYTILSLAPLLVLLIALAGLVFGEQAAQGQLYAQVRDLVGPEGGKAIEGMVQNASRPGAGIAATIIGFLTLLVGASTVANELKVSLNKVWNHEPDAAGIKTMVKQRSYALLVVLGCGFLLLVSLAVSSTIAAAGALVAHLLPLPEALMYVLNLTLSILVITGVFAAMFRFLPDVDVNWRDVLPGALFTAVLFTAGKFLIGLYLGKASFGSTYGAAGSLVIVLVWVYYSAQIFFFGAEFTQIYAEEHGSDPFRRRRQDNVQTSPKPVAALPEDNSRTGRLASFTANGSTGLSSTPEQKSFNMVGAILGSALAATKIVRGFRK